MFDYDDHIARAAGAYVMACRTRDLGPTEAGERLVRQTFHRLDWLVDARVLFLDPDDYLELRPEEPSCPSSDAIKGQPS